MPRYALVDSFVLIPIASMETNCLLEINNSNKF